MNLQGSCLSFPFRVDNRGSLVTTTDTVAEAIKDLVETLQSERVMLPDYGIPDFIFEVQDRTFATRLGYELKQQIKAYVPLVDSADVTVETDEDGKTQVQIQYFEAGSIDAPKNLVFPIWRLDQ